MMRKLLYSFLLFIFSKSSSKRTFTINLGLLCFGMFFVVNFGFAQSAYITQRGASTTANTTSNNTLTITKPTGVVEGDVMIVNIAQVGSNTLSSPSLSGWTAISSSNLGVTSNPYRWGAVLYKIATASEPANYSFSLNANSTATIGSIVAFSGVDISNPLDVAATSNNNTGTSPLTVSGLTTVTPNAALIMFEQSANSSPTLSNWTTANSGALTELYDDRRTTSGTQATVGAAWLNTVGAVTNTGNGSVTLSNNSGRNGAVLVALRPYTYKSLITGVNTGSTNWCAGETRNVTVTIQNTGTATWNDGPSRDFNIGIKWNTNGSSWSDYNVRVDAQNLAPGDTRTYTFSITASDNTGTYGSPLAAGTNRLTFDVVFEQVAWFGNNNGGTGPGNNVYTTPNQTIIALPANKTVGAASSTFCAGNGTNITVANSDSGISYQLRNGTTAVGSPVAGGGNINLPTGILNTTTTFNVLATNTTTSCSTQMTNTPTITVNPLPTASNAGPNQNGSGPFTLAANTPTAGTGVWAIVSGPNTSTSQLSSTTSPTATFNPIGIGTYVLSWTISNSCGNSTSQVTIVANCVSNLLKNGNFNNGTADWSAATGRGIYTEVLTEGLYFSNGSPNNTAELDSEASLRQQVTVIPNTTYTLSFIYARRPNSEATVGVTARALAGTTPISTVNYTTNNTTSTPFTGTLTFTTSSTTSTIFVELYNTLSNTTLGSIVDNIVLTPSPQVAPMATTVPKGSFSTLSPVCAGTAVQLDVDNVPATGVTYSWSSSSPGAVFSSTTIKNPTVTFASTLTGIQEVTVVVTPTTGCAGAPSTTYVNLIAAPTVFNVTGGTTTCFGSSAVIGLSGSSANVSYQLQLNGTNNGPAVTGTGSAISFGTKTAAGTYTVIATNITPNTCSLTMSGNAIIKAIQATPSVASFTDIDCLNSTGTIRLGNLPSGAWTINQTGQATATLTGSGTPYDVTGLAAGSYTFTVQTVTTCASVSVSQPIADNSTSTWNGATWVGGAPTSSKRIIIAANGGTPFPAGTPVVNGCSLTVNPGVSVIVASGVTLVITNAVTTNGQLTFRSGSSLMQTTDVANTGQINYERTTNVRRLDATYWSMPVTNAGFTMASLSPNTLSDKYLYYDPNSTWTVNLNGTMPMEVGKGYSIRAPQPFDTNTPAAFTGIFIGVPNNGPISPTVVQDKYNLVGNPYPSAISATALINGNTNLGTLYFWTHNSSPIYNPADGKSYYNNADFAAFNLTGGTDTSSGATLNGQPFQGYIAAGQGFLARPKTATLNFVNGMRRSANNSQFYKTDESAELGEIERNRLWLNFSNDQGAFKQALIGYIEGATNSFDINFDANTLGSNSSADFYSINESNNMTIQGRALPFDNQDVIPLGYKAATAGEYTIAIDHADGFFDSQEVYLEDLLTAKTINLRSENYKFTTAIGTFTNRFNLRYTSKTLGTGEFEDLENSVVVSLKNKVVKITSSKENIKNVNIYNIGAQVLYTKDNVNSSQLQISNLNSSNQVLLVKITLENGHAITKKVVYSNL